MCLSLNDNIYYIRLQLQSQQKFSTISKFFAKISSGGAAHPRTPPIYHNLIKLTEPGGYLVSCSCSQYMTPELFLQMLKEAAMDCGRHVRLLETLVQSRDHPACLNAEQALYLKGYILQVL